MGFLRRFLPLAFVLSTGAWRLDQDSCSDTVLAGHLKDSVNEAFDVVSGALDELEKKPQRSSEVNRLLELLFAPAGTTGAQYNVAPLVNMFRGIGAMSQQDTGTGVYKNLEDFVLFCNGDRIGKKTGGVWPDTYSGHNVGKDTPCTKAGLTDPTLAETYQMDQDNWAPFPGLPADQLQLCPWFLDWYKAEKYRTWKDIGSRKAKLGAWVAPKITGVLDNKNKWWAPLTPIDGTALMTKVLIHEMTHMRLGGPSHPFDQRIGRTEDVDMKLGKGLHIPGGLWDTAYGWTAAKTLAKEDPNWITEDLTDQKKIRYPYQNADSVALFAVATRLLRDDFKTRVNDKGELEDLPSQAKRYMSVPEVLEGFIKRTQKEQNNGVMAM